VLDFLTSPRLLSLPSRGGKRGSFLKMSSPAKAGDPVFHQRLRSNGTAAAHWIPRWSLSSGAHSRDPLAGYDDGGAGYDGGDLRREATCLAAPPAPRHTQLNTARTREEMPRILMTGASGGIGTSLRKLLPPIYPDLLLSDLMAPADLGRHEKFKAAELSDLAQVEAICEGVDGILHFGGYSVEGPWDSILQSNIIGCYNLFEAARKKGVKRIVFASSNHAVGFYPRHHRIGTDVTARPDSRYGVSKVFGEAVGALYADKHGMKVTCIRIGNFGEKPLDHRRLSIWLKPEDLVQLCRIGLEHPDIHFEIFYGASHNERSWWDNHRAHDLGYRPTGRAEEFREHAFAEQAKLGPDPVGDFYQGGAFCGMEFDGDKSRIIDDLKY
jgi:uronate dehydrogenase